MTGSLCQLDSLIMISLPSNLYTYLGLSIVHQLFLLRYWKLLWCAHNPCKSQVCFPCGKIMDSNVTLVKKDNSSVRSVLDSFVDLPNVVWDIGHLATISCNSGEDIVIHYAFA